jgi:hypothetical protein
LISSTIAQPQWPQVIGPENAKREVVRALLRAFWVSAVQHILNLLPEFGCDQRFVCPVVKHSVVIEVAGVARFRRILFTVDVGTAPIALPVHQAFRTRESRDVLQ